MKRALIIGSSGGIGSAVYRNLHDRGIEVDGLSRLGDGLDITSEASVERLLDRLTGTYDLIFVATGVLAAEGAAPEKSIREVAEDALLHQYRINAIGPMLVLKHCLRLLPKDRRALFAVLSARVGSIGDNAIGGWHSYRASKAALNQLIHGAAIELKRTHKQAIAVCLHPGTVQTSFTEKYAGRHKTVSAEDAASNLLDVMGNLDLDQTGGFFDYAHKEILW